METSARHRTVKRAPDSDVAGAAGGSVGGAVDLVKLKQLEDRLGLGRSSAPGTLRIERYLVNTSQFHRCLG